MASRKKKKGEKSKSMTVVCEHDQSDALAQQLCTTTTRIHKNTQKPKQIKIDFRFRTWKEKKFPDRKGESRHELFYTPSGLWHNSIKWKILVKRASSTRTTSRVQQGIRNRIDLEKSHGKWEMMWKLFFFSISMMLTSGVMHGRSRWRSYSDAPNPHGNLLWLGFQRRTDRNKKKKELEWKGRNFWY